MLYSFEDYVLDTARRELRRGTDSLAVEPQVFDLLTYLIENRERVVSKDDLRMSVWQGRIVSESTQSYYINAARTAIGDNGEDQRCIRTLPRKGFRFVAPVEQEESPAAPAAAAGVSTGELSSTPAAHPPPPVPAFRPGVIMSIAAGLVVIAVAALVVWRVSGPTPDAPTVPSGTTFDAASVPLVDDEVRRGLAAYPSRPDFKALAISGKAMGLSDGAPNVEAARQGALQRCAAKAMRQCRLYAVGMDVVWSKESLPLPATQDLRFEPLELPLVPHEIPTLDRTRRDAIANVHMKKSNHRALAMTIRGDWTISEKGTRAEAARLALERCTEFWQRPCLLLAIDGLLTMQIPKTRPVVGIFLPSMDAELAGDDKERIGKIYQGAEWRALARGKNGSWHAVAAAPSEGAAVEAALKACAQADQACRLYAIGNFRVPGE